MKDVYEAMNLADAHLLKGLLEADGIPAEIRGGAHHATRGEVGGIPGMLPVVWVLYDSDFERAAALVKAYPGKRPGSPGPAPAAKPTSRNSTPAGNAAWPSLRPEPGFLVLKGSNLVS